MPRVFNFRGKSPEELQSMKLEQYLPLIPSRERRAIKRMGMQYKTLVSDVEEARKSGATDTIHTRVREAVILPSWIGMRFGVHNGKEYKDIGPIKPEMMGHRLGEYSFTTKHVQHSAPGIRATRGSKFLAVK